MLNAPALSLEQELAVLVEMLKPYPSLSRTFLYFTRDAGERFAKHLANPEVQQALLAAVDAFREKDATSAAKESQRHEGRDLTKSLLDAADAQGGHGKFGDDLYNRYMTFAALDGSHVFNAFYFPKPGASARMKIYADSLNHYAQINPDKYTTHVNEALVQWHTFTTHVEKYSRDEIEQLKRLTVTAFDKALESTYKADPAQSLKLIKTLQKNANCKIHENSFDKSIQIELEERKPKVKYKNTPEGRTHNQHVQNMKAWLETKIGLFADTNPQAALDVAFEIEAINLDAPVCKKLPIIKEGVLNSSITPKGVEMLFQSILYKENRSGLPEGEWADKAHATNIVRALVTHFFKTGDVYKELSSLSAAHFLTRNDKDAEILLKRYNQINVLPYAGIIDRNNKIDANNLCLYTPLKVAGLTQSAEIESSAFSAFETAMRVAIKTNVGDTVVFLQDQLIGKQPIIHQYLHDQPKKKAAAEALFIKLWQEGIDTWARRNSYAANKFARNLAQERPDLAEKIAPILQIIEPLETIRIAAQSTLDAEVAYKINVRFHREAAEITPLKPAEFIAHVANVTAPAPAKT